MAVRTAPLTRDHFRPDVEGLRAVAVVLVLLYHAQVPFFGGGYVGVDVFFVISGFLITGLLLRELDATGRLSFTGFYARRVRRLLPASALTLLVTLIASVVLLSPVRIPDVAADIASAGAYVSNFRFGIAANDYFAANAAPSPVLHFWSLSVEEQFYFVWPSVLLILFALARRLHVGRRGLFIGMAVLSGASLLGCIWLTGVNQAWAFYLLPTRAWELGLGALLAISAGRVRLPGQWTPAALVVLGLAAIALSAVAFSDATAFPGYAAILPVAGTGLAILGGSSASVPARVLSLSPFTFLGRISYSVYLWHWPMLLFAGVLYGTTLPWPLAVLVALASLPVAAITQRLVEQPFRIGRFIGTRPRINLSQAVAAALVLALLAGASSLYARSKVDGELQSLLPPIGNPQPTSSGWCISDASVDDLSQCVSGDATSSATLLLFGDSQAEQWYYPLRQIADSRGWRFVSLTRPGCYPRIFDVAYQAEQDCPDWREHVFARIAAEQPDLIVLASYARSVVSIDGRAVDGSVPANRANVMGVWRDALIKTLARLAGSVGKVALIGATPLPGVDVPTCLELNPESFDQCARPLSNIPLDWHRSDQMVAAELGATFIDPTPWLCTSQLCPAVIESYLVYWDTEHLSEPFSASLAHGLESELPTLGGTGFALPSGSAPSAGPSSIPTSVSPAPPGLGVTILDPLETPAEYAAEAGMTLSAAPDVPPGGGYSGTSFQAAIAGLPAGTASASTRSVALDLSGHGDGALFRMWIKASTLTNLRTVYVIFFSSNSDWAAYGLSPAQAGTWQEMALAKGAPSSATNIDWRHVIAIKLRTDASAAGPFSGDVLFRDLRIVDQ